MGPLSFAIDNEGNVYILDTVNNRIQIFSSSGVYLSTISLQKDIFPEDIAVDKYGFIYIVNSQEEKLYQFNKKGDIIKSISMGKTRWVSGEPIHIVNNKIYVYMCDEICGDKLIGEIDNGKLSVNTDEDRKKSFKKGKQGISDRRYIASLVKHEDTGSNRYEGKVEIIDKYEITSITLTFPLEGINGIDFLGEDNNKDLHIKTSRVEDKTLIFEVHEFDANGKYLSTIRMPEGDDYFRAVKSILVSK
ncbi:MAG: hypothetical protein HZC49_07435, partial [Nitrospirae bacterium]|nr:hypothetical protein [Nitrospirota bacterium]